MWKWKAKLRATFGGEGWSDFFHMVEILLTCHVLSTLQVARYTLNFRSCFCRCWKWTSWTLISDDQAEDFEDVSYIFTFIYSTRVYYELRT